MSTCTRIGIQRIVFPTDFSDESVQAVEFVRKLQRHFKATVHVVHVLDLLPFSLSSDPAALAKIEALSESAREQLQRFTEAHGLKGDSFKPGLLKGEVSPALEEFTRQQEIDLIVLGSRGQMGMSRLFEGSMAEEIFRTALCPVIVIGPDVRTPEDSETFERLLFPTDLGPFSRAAAPYIEFLLTENPRATVSLAHFLEHDPGTPYERYTMRHEAENELKNIIPPGLRRQIRDVAVEFCSPAQGMIEMAKGFGADLMVLGIRSGGSFTRAATHGWCSMTHQIVSQAPCAILTIRST
jgi:nucleotide-binding universal stress UspA family protein